jgi:hypothetical protein
MSLSQLVYLSVEAESFSKNDLEHLLIGARKFNSERDISGFLVYLDGMFLQCLEGDKKAINDLYEHIKCDVRHKEVQLVFEKAINERVFADWSMGFLHASKDDLEKYGFKSVSDFVAQNEDQKHPALVFMSSVINNSKRF